MLPWMMALAAIDGIDGLPASAIPQLTNVSATSTTLAGNAALTLSWRCTNIDAVNYEIRIYRVDPGHATGDPLYIPAADVLLATQSLTSSSYTFDTGVATGDAPWYFTFKFRIDVVHTTSGDEADSETISAGWVG